MGVRPTNSGRQRRPERLAAQAHEFYVTGPGVVNGEGGFQLGLVLLVARVVV